jgi:hypothetical protein
MNGHDGIFERSDHRLLDLVVVHLITKQLYDVHIVSFGGRMFLLQQRKNFSSKIPIFWGNNLVRFFQIEEVERTQSDDFRGLGLR